MTRIGLLSLFILIGSTLIGQSENPFLNRAYWTENPSIKQITTDIEKGNDPSAFNAHKFNAVTWAIIEGTSNETVWFLLQQKGNDVNKRAHDGRTPIFWAAYKNNVTFMQELISKGAKTDLIDDHGFSLINFAASTGQLNTDLYDLCFENGAKVETEKNNDGATPLLLLIPHLQTSEMIDYFVEKGLSLAQTDAQGNNAFVYAAKTGNQEIMNHLIEQGLDPKANNSAAVIFASKGTRRNVNSVKTYEYLKSLGLSLTTTDAEGRTALHYLSNRCEDLSVLTFFVKQGIELIARDKKGNTPFLNAVSNNSIEVIRSLSEKMNDLNIKNERGENALHLAVKRNDLEVLTFVLDMELDINSKTTDGLTPLHLAAMTAKDDKLMKMLVDAGADRRIKTPFEETAFELANENEILMKEGISLNFLK